MKLQIGFSLVEVLLALSLISSTSLGILFQQMHSTQLLHESLDRMAHVRQQANQFEQQAVL